MSSIRRKGLALFLCAAVFASLTVNAGAPYHPEPYGPARISTEFQMWYRPLAELFADPDVIDNPELFNPTALDILWMGVLGEPIGPDCPLLLCAMHPLGLALLTGGLVKTTNEEESIRMADLLIHMREVFGNRYRKELPFDGLNQYYGLTEEMCGILGIRVSYEFFGHEEQSRRVILHHDHIAPERPLYDDMPDPDFLSLIDECLKQCPCVSGPGEIPEPPLGPPVEPPIEPPLGPPVEPPPEPPPQIPPKQPTDKPPIVTHIVPITPTPRLVTPPPIPTPSIISPAPIAPMPTLPFMTVFIITPAPTKVPVIE